MAHFIGVEMENVEGFKVGDWVYFLGLYSKNKVPDITNTMPVIRIGEIEFIGQDGLVHLKHYRLFRSLDCIFKTKKELINYLKRAF
jgi:hypothetical protein